MPALDGLRLVGGSVALYLGADWLVAGAAGLAAAFGVRPLVIGLTVVAYGTSAPELVVALDAARSGRGGIAFGNVVGSNLANFGLILGLAALLAPPAIEAAVRRRDAPLLAAVTLLWVAFAADGRIGPVEGAALAAGAFAYSVHLLRGAAAAPEPTETASPVVPWRRRLLLLVQGALGLVVLAQGGSVFVDGAVGLARSLGVTERVIGLTVVAVGTSVPELATSLVAARRGHTDLAVGNVVGSNLFNLLLVVGIAALVAPVAVPAGALVDLVALVTVTGLGCWFLIRGRVLPRAQGAVLLGAYVAYLMVLVLQPP